MKRRKMLGSRLSREGKAEDEGARKGGTIMIDLIKHRDLILFFQFSKIEKRRMLKINFKVLPMNRKKEPKTGRRMN